MLFAGMEIKELAAKYGTPLYVYDFQRISDNISRLKKAFTTGDVEVDIFYAMKANCHPAIIDLIKSYGLGMDCVSPGELEVALKCGVEPAHILYTANYESVAELEIAYRAGVMINLDDVTSLDRLLRIGTPAMISYRINPGKGRGKYEQITTGGEKAKFGVPHEKAVEAYRRAQMAGIGKFGAHMMTGSGILDAAHFPNMLELLLSKLAVVAEELGITFEFIDMGGGLGIPYFGDNEILDVEEVGRSATRIFRKKVDEFQLGDPVLSLEPGRYIVGDAGILITQVTGIKSSYRNLVGVDAGFNTLIRSAMYHAQHPIIVDGKEDSEDRVTVDICGQICENTDIFTRDREIPRPAEGDLLVFTQAGAYGNVMSMPYNLRFRPAEIAIIDDRAIEITRRETIADYYSRITYPNYR